MGLPVLKAVEEGVRVPVPVTVAGAVPDPDKVPVRVGLVVADPVRVSVPVWETLAVLVHVLV